MSAFREAGVQVLPASMLVMSLACISDANGHIPEELHIERGVFVRIDKDNGLPVCRRRLFEDESVNTYHEPFFEEVRRR